MKLLTRPDLNYESQELFYACSSTLCFLGAFNYLWSVVLTCICYVEFNRTLFVLTFLNHLFLMVIDMV